MKQDDEILESLVAGGLIGAALGALISNNKSGTGLGALAGAALFATLKANENAKATNIPLVMEEQHILYEVNPDGSRKILKKLPRTNKRIPKRFTLK